MASSSSTHEAVYCQKGLGFIRLAMSAGKNILPMYCFGENQMWVTSSAFLEGRRWIAKKFRVGVPLMRGRFYTPLCVWPLPTKTHLVIGREIFVGKKENPTEEEVQKIFGLYVDEISRIWATNARQYLPKDVADNGLQIEVIGVGVVREVKAK